MGIEANLALALDRVRFARRVGFLDLDDWQIAVLRSNADRVLLNASRQAGKSSVSAVVGLHRALYWPESLVLILAPSQRQSQELFLKVKKCFRALGDPDGFPADAPRKLSLELANGSRIHALPGSEATVRGFSDVDLLLVDEGARIDDDLYAAVSPMLAVSGGSLYLLSTPAGQRGVFYELWEEGDPAWERHEVSAWDVPRIGHDFLRRERRILGRHFFEQEYENKFHEVEGAVWSEETIRRFFTDDTRPLFPYASAMTEDAVLLGPDDWYSAPTATLPPEDVPDAMPDGVPDDFFVDADDDDHAHRRGG